MTMRSFLPRRPSTTGPTRRRRRSVDYAWAGIVTPARLLPAAACIPGCRSDGRALRFRRGWKHLLVVENLRDVLLDPVVVEQLAHEHAAIAGGAHLFLERIGTLL